MRIAINAYYAGEPSLGFGRHTANLLEGIRRHGDPAACTLLVPGPPDDKTRAALAGFPLAVLPRVERLPWGERLPELVDLSAFDLLYVPYSVGPLVACPCPYVVTIHDAIAAVPFSRLVFAHPTLLKLASLADRRQFARELASARGAARVTTVSAAARADLLRHGLAPERVAVTPNAVGEAFVPQPAARVAALREARGLPEDYLLYVGGIRARKNVGGLLAAYRHLPAALRARHALVVAGALPAAERRAAARLAPGRVFELGPVAEDELPALYTGARLLVFLSFYEGFGLPPVEAAACGTPSLVSDTSSLPEVGAGFSVTTSPYRPRRAARALAALLADGPRLAALAAGCAAARARYSLSAAHAALWPVLEAAAAAAGPRA